MAAFYGRDSDDAFIEECGTDAERAALRARRDKPTSKARGPVAVWIDDDDDDDDGEGFPEGADCTCRRGGSYCPRHGYAFD